MEWKNHFDDEGRSFVEFLREKDQIITCMACSKNVTNKEDFNAVEKIYSHCRSIEHGFKLFVMYNLSTFVVDLTNCDENRENWSPKPQETKNVEITRNTDGSIKISGYNPIKYIVPIVDLPYIKNKIVCEKSVKTVLSSLDNYVTKSSPRKRKQSEQEDDSSANSSFSSVSDKATSPKKRKTSQLTLERWVKNDQSASISPSNISQQQVDQFVSPPSSNIPQQQVGQFLSTSSPNMSQQQVDTGLTKISRIRPLKRGVSQIIRARVVIKSDIHPFFNFLGATTMFTLDLIDESGEIRVSAYAESVNKLYDLVEVDGVYYFSKFKVKPSDASKTPFVSEYNITFTDETIIRPCILLQLQIPRLTFNFQPIANVEKMVKDDIIDVIAICESFGEVQHKRLSNGSPGRSRDIWLVDHSMTKILLYIWGTNADKFEVNRPGDVIAVKRAKVKNFAKLNLDSSCLSSSTFEINPKIPEADDLREWYSQKGNRALKVLSSVPRPKKVGASKR